MTAESVVKTELIDGNSRAGAEISSRTLTLERRRRLVLKVSAAITFLAGMAPLLFIIWLCNATGANNICVDYAAFVHIIDKAFSGTYQWSDIFSDSFIRTHMVLLPVLVHMLVAYLTHWDVTVELYVGIAMHLTRAFLIADMLSMRATRWTRLAVFGAVSALVFMMSQTCIMIYGEASIAIGLCLLGFSFALWSLVRYGRTPFGLMMMVLGGLASCYSFGNVVPCWLALFAALFFLPPRSNRNLEDRRHDRGFLVGKPVSLVYWLAGAVISLSPYAFFLLTRGALNPELTRTFGLFNPTYIIGALGRPFAKDMGLVYGRLPAAEVSFWILLVLTVFLSLALLRKNERLSTTFRISSILFIYGLSSIWNVAVFRTHIAPWYASFALYCWLALFGICLVHLQKLKPANTVYGAAGILTILVLYLSTNLTYRDKQFFLNARAPVSAEYLRQYTTAPTFLESTVFSNDGRPDRVLSFAGALQRHALCVFSPNQSWSLQGQFAFENVSIDRLENSPRLLWIDGQSLKGASTWRDYRHLNLVVPVGNAVHWKFTVPADAVEAVFKTAVSSCRAGRCSKTARSAATVTVTPLSSAQEKSTACGRKEGGSKSGATHVIVCEDNWKTVRLNLLPYRGRTVSIGLSAASLEQYYSGVCDNRDCLPGSALYKYPLVDITLPRSASQGLKLEPNLVPSNTDLSPAFPHFYFHRVDLPPLKSASWKPVAMPIPEDTSASIGARFCDFAAGQGMRTDDFDYLLMDLQAIPGKTWCSMKLHLQYDDGTIDGVSLPLLPDGKRHSYVYPTRLLTAKSGARLVRVVAYAAGTDQAAARKRRRALSASKMVAASSAPLKPGADNRAEISGCVYVDALALIRCINR